MRTTCTPPLRCVLQFCLTRHLSLALLAVSNSRRTHSSQSRPFPRTHQREMAEKAISREAMETLEQQGFVVIDGAISGQEAAKALKGCEMMQRFYFCVYARERERGTSMVPWEISLAQSIEPFTQPRARSPSI